MVHFIYIKKLTLHTLLLPYYDRSMERTYTYAQQTMPINYTAKFQVCFVCKTFLQH